MPAPPYAKILVALNGGAFTSGPLQAKTGDVLQFKGESTVDWVGNPLWEIFEYPAGFAVPTGWALVGNSIQSTDVVPQPVTLGPWGKYFPRLTVNGGMLDGVRMGVGSKQPQVDEATAFSVPSPNLGLFDVGAGETNIFDLFRQWIGAIKGNFRKLDAANPFPLSSPTTTTTAVTANQVIATIPIAANSGVTKINLVVAAHRTGVAEGYTADFATSYYDNGAGPVIMGTDTVGDPKTVGGASASLNSAVSGQNVVIRATPWNAGSTKWVVAAQAVGPAT